MVWEVTFHEKFEDEFDSFVDAVQAAILARAKLLEIFAPSLGRPHVGTLSGSRLARMKELRCPVCNSECRVALAFDQDRKAILLVAGNKAGVNQKRFYKRLISKADERLDQHFSSG